MGGALGLVIYIVAIVAIFYFLFMKPQKKQEAEKRRLLEAIEVGDCIVTTSGFYGMIIDVSDDDVIVEFGNNKNCRIPMQKAAIAQVEKAETASEK